ncbi:hypothetical protein [Clavibacter tessellarius]
MQLGSGNVAEPRWREWREQLAGIGGPSPSSTSWTTRAPASS